VPYLRATPLRVRTQGLPLRWTEELRDCRVVELRDICPLNEDGVAIEDLPEEECWEVGPFEARLASLESAVDGGAMERVPLRRLFDTPSEGRDGGE